MRNVIRLMLVVLFATVVIVPNVYAEDVKPSKPPLKPMAPQEKTSPTKGQKTMLPDLTIVGSLRMAREPEVGEVAGSGPHRGERWFAVLFHFDVENRGEAPAERFENWLVSEGRVGMQSAGRGIKNSLRPHERKTYGASFLIPLDYAGRTVRIRAYVDPLNETTESDETNNSSDWFEVRLPTLPSLPDLTVTIDNVEETGWIPDVAPSYLGFYNITFTVRNIGTASSRFTEWHIYYFDRGEWHLHTTAGTHPIAPGGSFTHRERGLSIFETATKVRVILDPENRERELEKSNNQAEKNMPPLPTGRPVLVADLSVTIDSIVRTGRSPGGDELYTINFTVKNNGTGMSGITDWQIHYFDGGIWHLVSNGLLGGLAPRHSISPTKSDLSIPERATKVRITVDPANVVPETDETNNQAERVMPVRVELHRPDMDIRR